MTCQCGSERMDERVDAYASPLERVCARLLAFVIILGACAILALATGA